MIAIGPLIGLTIQAPAQAAQQILDLRVPREGIWTGFALVQVLNTIVFTLQIHLSSDSGELFQIVSPLEHLVANAALQLSIAAALTWIGRGMKGKGGYLDVLGCMSWIGFVQIVALAGLTVVSLASPNIATMLGYALVVFALYISAHFLNQVHQLGSAWRGFVVLLLAILAIAFAVSFVLQAFLPGL